MTPFALTARAYSVHSMAIAISKVITIGRGGIARASIVITARRDITAGAGGFLTASTTRARTSAHR